MHRAQRTSVDWSARSSQPRAALRRQERRAACLRSRAWPCRRLKTLGLREPVVVTGCHKRKRGTITMNIASLLLKAFSVCAAVAVLAACSSNALQSALGPSTGAWRPGQFTGPLSFGSPRFFAATMRITAHPDRGRSWMAFDAKKADLLYIADTGTNDVYVYSYPKNKLTRERLRASTRREGCALTKPATFLSRTYWGGMSSSMRTAARSQSRLWRKRRIRFRTPAPLTRQPVILRSRT